MRMIIYPWVEVAESLRMKLGYEGGKDYEMSGDVLHSIVEAGFDIMVRQGREGGPPEVQVAPGGRGFHQR